jgi:hypothetical protein
MTLYTVFTVDNTTKEESWCRDFGTMTEATNYIQCKIDRGSLETYKVEVIPNQEVYEVK